MDDRALTEIVRAADPLVSVYALAQGRAERLDQLHAPCPAGGFRWIHLNRHAPRCAELLAAQPNIPPMAVQALLEDDTRPRLQPYPDGCVLILRGMHVTPEDEPDELVSLRLWIDRERVISVRGRRVRATAQLREQLDRGLIPSTTAGLVIRLLTSMSDNLGDLADAIDDILCEMEDQVLNPCPPPGLQTRLAHNRRRMITLRRYMGPQEHALRVLAQELPVPFAASEQPVLREIANRFTRLLEDLHHLHERAGMVHGEIAHQLQHAADRRMRLLGMLGGVFLPLTFLTGLFGMNVAGIPGSQNSQAFLWVCTAMAALLGAQLVFLRHKGWW